MSFIWPAFLWFLLLVPILVVLYLFAQRRRQKYAVKFANLALIRKAAGNGPGFRRHIPAILTFAALAMLCLGLARPTALVPLLSGNGLVVLALDISGSMRARDIDPSRFEAAQAAARAFG